MNNNLIPEQRPDKNGNVVTRWVRGMFDQKEQSRSIPKVSLSGSGISKKEAKALRDQMLARFDRPAKPLDFETLRGMEETEMSKTVWGITNSEIINKAYDKGNYTSLVVMDRFGESHGYAQATMVGQWLVRGNLKEEAFTIAGEQIDAFKTFSDVAYEVTGNSEKDENDQPIDLLNMSPIFSHVLMHPEDGPVLEKIVGRGVVDPDEVFSVLETMKADNLHSVIKDGAL